MEGSHTDPRRGPGRRRDRRHPRRPGLDRTSPSSCPTTSPTPGARPAARARKAPQGLGGPAEGLAPSAPSSTRAMAGDLPDERLRRARRPHRRGWPPTSRRNATRVHSGAALEALIPAIPEMIGGSADLTGSNNTFVKGMPTFDAPDYAGRYVHYGVREFGMAAAMNGMALHGGVIPYSGTFLVFSDYSRPAIRLGGLMGVRVIHVMTHDSIGLGEDGPTHQPVEHLAALRAMPEPAGLPPRRRGRDRRVLEAGAGGQDHALGHGPVAPEDAGGARPAAAREPVGQGRLRAARRRRRGQGDPVRHRHRGARSPWPPASCWRPRASPTRVVSVPCFELFEPQAGRLPGQTVIGAAPVRVAVEAGVQPGLGAVHRRGRRLRRHDRLRRQRALRAALPASSASRRAGGGAGQGEAAAKASFLVDRGSGRRENDRDCGASRDRRAAAPSSSTATAC